MNELIHIPVGTPSRVGLDIPEGTTEQEWKAIGHNLLRCKDSLQFWIGDWVNYGQAAYGEKYDEAMKVFGGEGAENYGYEKTTLENFASIAKRVHISRRREKLSFGHHDAVAALEPDRQEYFLAWAAMNHASVSDLRKEIRAKDKTPNVIGTSALVGKFTFETWFSEFDRGFNKFVQVMPIEKWSDSDLERRIEKLDEIMTPLMDAAKERGLEVAA